MEDARQRATEFIKALPVAHRVLIVSALAGLVMAGMVFAKWVTTPSYTVLYSGLTNEAVAASIEQLETLGVPYKLEGGGSTVLVPRDQLYTTRASLAAEGLSGSTTPPGYELLDSQGLSVSDFRQRVDYQRALEGELSKTLMAMNGVNSATVRLVLPEEELFAENQEPVTASILLNTTRELNDQEVETVTFLVSSAVEGLTPDSITVADARGNVLHAPGDAGGTSVTSNRNMRQTRDFEQALAADIKALLAGAGGAPASVVVRASLNFDERQTETETYDPDNQVTTSEQVITEEYEGVGARPGGAVGVDGGPVPDIAGQENTYSKEQATREFGVSRTTAQTISAPGAVDRLSVAVVMDDGSVTGADVLPAGEAEDLISAAVGLDEARGDTLAVSLMPMPRIEDAAVEEEPEGLLAMLPQIVAAVVLLLVCLALVLMTRRRKAATPELVLPDTMPAELQTFDIDELGAGNHALQPVGAPQSLEGEVRELVQSQPEEIALLLRSWLADRRN